jgi:hypothetical protein
MMMKSQQYVTSRDTTRDEPEAERKPNWDKETRINDFNIPGLYNIISHVLTIQAVS